MKVANTTVAAIRQQPLIPFCFAGIALLGLLYSLSGQIKTRLMDERVTLGVGAPVLSPVFKLDPDRRYTLDLEQVHEQKKYNTWASLSVAMVHVESEEEIFELEDNYWAERGIWREQGESGTWEEINAKTRFHFRVAESGEYRLEMALSEHLSRPFITVQARVSERKPVKLHWIPMLVAVLGLLGLAAWAAHRRQDTMCNLLEDLTAGSTLQILGKRYTVMDVRIHEDTYGTRPGYEWRLRADDGEERYLAVETFEYYGGWSEDEIQGRYLMIDQPGVRIEPVPGKEEWQARTIEQWPTLYEFDADNSGLGKMTTLFEGESYVSRYQARIFRDAAFPAPSAAGKRIVEYVRYIDTQEEEWCVMQILSWRDIESINFYKPVGA